MTQKETLNRLAGDRPFQLAVAVSVVVVIPYVAPLLNEDQLWWFHNIVVNMLLQGCVLLAVLVGTGGIDDPAERRFWRCLALAWIAILAIYPSWAWGEIYQTHLAELAGQVLLPQAFYVAFYLLIAFAIDSNAAVTEGALIRELRWVRTAGLGIALAGFLTYFAVLPLLTHRDDQVSWPPFLLIYAILDVFLAVKALRARSRTRDERWRGLLGWMAFVLLCFAVLDFTEAADWAGLVNLAGFGWIIEMPWHIPPLIMVAGARIFLTDVRPRTGAVPDEPSLVKGGPLIAYAAVLPLLHFLLHASDVLDPQLRMLREILVLLVLVAVGGLAFWYQRRVEGLNRETHQELQESRERYGSFVEMSVEGIWLLEFDPPISIHAPVPEQVERIYRQGVVVESNDTMAQMHGYTDAAETVGRRISELFHAVRYSEMNADATARLVTSGYRVTRETLEYVDSLGRKKWVEGSMVGAVENGFLVQAWATQVDVTPRFQAEQEREELEQQLRRSQRLETIGTLAGGIAHDFNNILAPILGFADLAEDSVEPDDRETRASIGQIKTAANRAKELVSQILAVGQQRDNIREPVHVSDVVADALDLLNQSLPSTISLETCYQKGCPPASADPAQLHQVVMNLCTNSAQAMPDSDGTIRIDVTCESIDAPPDGWEIRPERYVVLSVTDDGQGMSEDTVSRAVEPFYTTKEAGRGSGLGLSVTHGIVQGHGGHLELESEEGVGTRVTVYLPAGNGASEIQEESLGEEVVTSDATARLQRRGTTPVDVSDSPRVMLVDDEVGVAQTCEAMLRRLGYRVESFTDSVAAKDALASGAESFDLLLTDHTMPEITGPELAALALEKNRSIAVVIASGHRFGDDSSPDGQVVRLEKPFTVAELQASVEKALGTG